MKVFLDGVSYELVEGTSVNRQGLVEWSDNLRFDGQQQRKDRRFMSSWAIDNWSGGLGVQDIKVGSTSNLLRLWDVENCDTRWDSIILSPALNTCTIVPSQALDLPLQYLNNFYLCNTGAVNLAFAFTPPFTLGSYRQPVGDASYAAINIKGIGGFVCGLGRAPNGYTALARCPAMGGAPSYANITTASTSYGEIGNFGGTIHTIIYSVNTQRAYFSLFDANLSTPASVATVSVNVGTYLAPLVTDGLSMYAQLPDGIYDFDDTPAKIVDTERVQDLNCVIEMFRQELYFKSKNSTLRYDGAEIASVGYDGKDGLPSDKIGQITAMCSSYKFLFAAVKGATYSHILSYDKDNSAWQYYSRIPTAGLWVRRLVLSDSPDTIDRLWVLYGNYAYPGYYLSPLTNPLQAATYAYVPTGHFTPPIYGGDLPEEGGAFYDVKYDLNGMGGSNIITSFYGINGANPVSTLGVAATTNFTHIMGSPYGVEANRIQPDFMLAGANSGTTPIFKSAVFHYLKDPDKRSIFDFSIDIDKSTQPGVRSREAVIGSLNYELSRRTLMPFWYGQMGTVNVKAMDMPFAEKVPNENAPLFAQREGIVQVRLAEIL